MSRRNVYILETVVNDDGIRVRTVFGALARAKRAVQESYPGAELNETVGGWLWQGTHEDADGGQTQIAIETEPVR